MIIILLFNFAVKLTRIQCYAIHGREQVYEDYVEGKTFCVMTPLLRLDI